MRLNKCYSFVTILLVLVLLFFSASAYSQQIYKWKVPTGSATGTYYPALSGIAMVLGLYTDDIYATASVGGGGASNARKVGTGEAAFSLTTSNIAYYATRGEQMFTESYPSIRAWGTLHKLYVDFLVRANSDIKSFADLKGKKVAIGEPGSGDAVAAEDVLKAAGLLDLVIKVQVGDPQNMDLLKLGQVDAIIHHTSSPNPNFYAFSTTTPIRALDMPKDVVDKLVDLGYFDAGVIKAGTYEGHEEDADVVVLPVLLIVNEDIPKEVVYEMTQVTWAHFDEVMEVAPYLKADVDLENILRGIPIPLHPGAYQYFQEEGYEIPDRLKP
jgi:uncharacterized protein